MHGAICPKCSDFAVVFSVLFFWVLLEYIVDTSQNDDLEKETLLHFKFTGLIDLENS